MKSSLILPTDKRHRKGFFYSGHASSRPWGDVRRDQGLHVGSSGPLLPTASSPVKTLMNLTTSVDTLVFSPDTQVCLIEEFFQSLSGISITSIVWHWGI